ncbi:MAG: YlzJ-like family protein [Firmicutes bacterium]|nr:YlzJ-like family protein [Bacillota bacterium]
MLWTIMPHEVVMEGNDTFTPTYTEIQRKGCTLIVEPLDMSTAKVIRIISTNPRSYLDPEFQPGSIIALTK